jgi:outer membrane receptor protein involved in Fe transport
LQDTWAVTHRLTANYGLRFDSYKQDQDLGQPGVSKDQTSPRVNLAYSLTPGTIWRVSYNRLFIEPPITQGAILGEPIQPETYSQYETSIEHQIASHQTAKLAYYYKDIRNQIDTGLLIPGTQIGAFASVNLEKGGVHGLEFSYDLTPSGPEGLGAYLAYTYSIAKPNGVDNTGEPVDEFNDHDQRHTLSAGLNYNFANGALAGLDVYYGSGLASSALYDGGPRTPYSLVNLKLLAPRTTGLNHSWIQLGVEADNLFDTRKVINFASDFSGTRFTQARTILLTATGSF